MGYSKSINIGDNAEFGGTPYSAITLTTVAGSQIIGEVLIPAIDGIVQHCYIDVYIGRIENTNGAVNYIDGTTSIRVNNDTGDTCCQLVDQSCYCPANSFVSGLVLKGKYDVASSVVVGGSIEIWLSPTANSKQNNLILHDVVCSARVILMS